MGYLALLEGPSGPEGLEAAEDHLRQAAGWSTALCVTGARVWVCGERPPGVRALPGGCGVLLGEVLVRGGAGVPARTADLAVVGRRADPPAQAGALLRQVFGGYVALFAGAAPAVFRDPSGTLGAVTWEARGVTLVADDWTAAPAWLRPPRLALDWARLARLVADPAVGAAELPLAGVEDLPPGTLATFGASPARQLAWRPSEFVDRRHGRPEAQVVEELRATVLDTVVAQVRRHDAIVGEISGGFDSAVVAGCVARGGLTDRVGRWINYYSDRPEGDERARAGDVAAGLGVGLESVRKVVRPLAEADLAELAHAERPPLNGLDIDRDRDAASRLMAMDATALLSGQGGDAVFFQMPTAAILADHLRLSGVSGLGDGLALDLARRLRRPVWAVLGEAARAVQTPRERAAGAAHPWLRDTASAGPAKRLQVSALAAVQLYRGPSRRGRAAGLLYPLASQPVMELALAIPAAMLVRGAGDRALARRAFADLLPAAVARRRGKGDLTAFYAQTAAASLDVLRPHLLDGVLCEAGLLDRRVLEAELASGALLWRGQGASLLLWAVLESWVRHWQARAPDLRPRPRG